MRHVQDGDPLIIQPKVWNQLLDGLERGNGNGGGSVRATRQSVTCFIRNDSGQDLPQFGIVGLDTPLILPSDNESEFLRKIVFSGKLVDHEATYDLKWGIALSPIRAGDFGEIVVQGLSFVKLDDATATTAAPKDGSLTTLTKADCGLARVLWRATGTGEQWAVVCLG